MEEKKLTEQESLALITEMINKTKKIYYDTGLSAMMWGIVITVCSLVRLAEIHFGFELPVDIYWLTIVAIIPQVLISIREKKEKRVRTYDDIYMDYLWFAFGISIALMIVITNVMFNAWDPVVTEYSKLSGRSSSFNFYEYIAPLFLLLYGIPTFVTGTACKFKPMLWGGLLCWVCCLITLFTSIKIDLALTAFSALAAWFIPGIIMQKEYRKAKKELAGRNV